MGVPLNGVKLVDLLALEESKCRRSLRLSPPWPWLRVAKAPHQPYSRHALGSALRIASYGQWAADNTHTLNFKEVEARRS